MKRHEIVILRPSKINPVFWGWAILYAIGVVGITLASLYHGTLGQNLKVIFILAATTFLILVALRFYMRFPVITVRDGILKLQVWWEEWEIEHSSIKKITKKRGFAAKPVLGNILHLTRPYWRIEVHYLENEKEKDVDIDLTQFRRSEIEALLAILKRLRPDLDIPSLDKRGL